MTIHIGYVGASITDRAVLGYHSKRVAGQSFWPVQEDGSGTLWRWLDMTATYLDPYDQALDTYPDTDRIWWQVAMHTDDLNGKNSNARYPLNDEQLYELAVEVRDALNARSGGLPLYVSGMAHYSPANLCPQVNDATLSRLDVLARRLISEGGCKPGPLMPALTRGQVVTSRLGCHQSGEGQRAHGQVLKNFFG